MPIDLLLLLVLADDVDEDDCRLDEDLTLDEDCLTTLLDEELDAELLLLLEKEEELEEVTLDFLPDGINSDIFVALVRSQKTESQTEKIRVCL
jgi:uncharacterized protein VirK/YbjX